MIRLYFSKVSAEMGLTEDCSYDTLRQASSIFAPFLENLYNKAYIMGWCCPLVYAFCIGIRQKYEKDFTDGSETRKEIDTPPQIIDGRTLVPIRAVSEALSVDISWNDDERTVVIKSEDLADEWQSDDSIDNRQ